MHKLLKIVVFPVALMLLLSTQGLLVFLHHCNHSGQTYVGLFSATVCDHDHHEIIEDLPLCCANDQPEPSSSDTKTCNKCCSDDHIFIKPDIQSLAGSSFHVDLSPKCSELFITHEPNFANQTSMPGGILVFRPKPPPKTGTFTLILYHSLKIPDLLS
jgi:hypothetical protein